MLRVAQWLAVAALLPVAVLALYRAAPAAWPSLLLAAAVIVAAFLWSRRRRA